MKNLKEQIFDGSRNSACTKVAETNIFSQNWWTVLSSSTINRVCAATVAYDMSGVYGTIKNLSTRLNEG